MPDPILKGRFNLYETADHGYHIAYLPDGAEETEHLEVPGMIVRLAKLAAEGKLNPMEAVKGLMSRA